MSTVPLRRFLRTPPGQWSIEQIQGQSSNSRASMSFQTAHLGIGEVDQTSEITDVALIEVLGNLKGSLIDLSRERQRGEQ